jgi:uncharacterized protein
MVTRLLQAKCALGRQCAADRPRPTATPGHHNGERPLPKRTTIKLTFAVVTFCCGIVAAADESPPIRQIFDVRTPMRDGAELSADVWLPAADGKYPVILIRTPYVKTTDYLEMPSLGSYFAGHGYAFVAQDTRGRGDSTGDFNFLFQEAQDGHDAIEALARQPWSNGRVCMMGVSYMGSVQWLAAKERPPHLVCIAPTSPGGKFPDEVPSQGGAFMAGFMLNYLNDLSGRIGQRNNTAAVDWRSVLAHRPLLTMDEALGRRNRLYREFLEHDTLDDYWKRINLTAEDFARINIPIMETTGFFDGDQIGTLFYWEGMQRRAGGPDRYLTIGPWNHDQSFTGGAEEMGGFKLPKSSIIDNKATHLAFFDRYLKQSAARLDWPRVRVFVTGADEWRTFDAFPVPGIETERLYLTGGGQANSVSGDGGLSWKKPGRAPADQYVFDPKNPVALEVARGMFGADRSNTQAREDVLVYSTPPLDKAVEVIGPISVELYAASDARDTDFTAALTDVQPDGKALLLGSRPVGIIRARYRHGREAQPALLTPGKVEFYRIDLGVFGHRFLPGHRIRIEISSSAAPIFNPNQNTGNPIATDTEWRIAHQSIFHDAQRPSALALPVSAK